MGYYVYQYLHPEYGHLYCGRTNNLDRRIYQHNNSKTDNIPKKYKELLNESIIMYVELQNKSQEISVEAYCIDKYKPLLNKSLKYDNKDSILEMRLPKWKIYEPRNLKYKQYLHTVEKEKEQLIEDISKIKKDIKLQKDHLNSMKFELNKINYEIKAQNIVKDENDFFAFDHDDVKWFYKNCENKEVKFCSKIYDRTGRFVAGGAMYYNSDKDILLLEYYDSTNKNSPYIANEEQLPFDVLCGALYNFYPNVNIYPELYVSLLSKKNELSIKNGIYDTNDLIDKYNNVCIHSVDDQIRVKFKNGEIYACCVYDNSSDFPYSWSLEDGVEVYDSVSHVYKYKKEKIDEKIKKRIFSSKYYTPEANFKEEEYCNEMLLKYNS